MRTTLTIEEDVAVRIESLQKERGWTLKRVINQVLRAGLDEMEDDPLEPAIAWCIEPVTLGARVGSVDDVGESLSIGEGEAWR